MTDHCWQPFPRLTTIRALAVEGLGGSRMSLDLDLLQDVCDRISAEINAVVTVFKSRGEIIASSQRSRIGGFHYGAARIMAGEADSYIVTAEDAAQSDT